MTATLTQTRPTLGDFSSIVCFKAVIVGIEDTLGEDGAAVVFTRAGKVRGHALARALGAASSNVPVEHIATLLNAAIGREGTKLCAVVKSYEQDGNVVIETQETVCSAGEAHGSQRKCTFTLGAVWGALEAMTDRTYMGMHTESVLRGGTCDKFVFTPLSPT
ncbi:hypothetical protein [Deinococcus yavapaiensis]|uniref:Hydrocarbon binding protein n=1 Tax=Deinococcus yavapaiensis KR-236 TaxID=694435 RepID=A0A318SDX4_9DEIO|nr:hypothetical protein [Deinococcus yavapaiensis]PYE50958.1 hypothetical protein DES52_11625 [Deinococcus yavapaiensis KR-236]